LSALCCLIFFYRYLANFAVFEFIILFLLAIFGLLIIISGNDLIIIYLGLELQGLCFYCLIALRNNSNLAIEAALKYFTLSIFSTGFLLLGISIIYGVLGSTNLTIIYNLIPHTYAFD